jgi:hypothetical protein
MKKKIFGIMMISFTILFISTACAATASEDLADARKQVDSERHLEKEMLYDNGENFLTVKTIDHARAEILFQDWQRTHPDKCIYGLTFTGEYGNVWKAYYNDKK